MGGSVGGGNEGRGRSEPRPPDESLMAAT
jgi:hypothetical protein